VQCAILHFELWLVLHHGWRLVNLWEEIGLKGWGLECLNNTAALDVWAERFPPGPLWVAHHYCASHRELCLADDNEFVIINHVDRAPKVCLEETTMFRNATKYVGKEASGFVR
jgi:hypothetical protein